MCPGVAGSMMSERTLTAETRSDRALWVSACAVCRVESNYCPVSRSMRTHRDPPPPDLRISE